MFLVDPETRRLRPVSDRMIHASRAAADGLDQELFLQQIETKTRPHTALGALRRDLAAQRRLAARSAESAGAALAAVATPVMPDDDGITTPSVRYRTMMETFGHRGLVCATHVHVEVAEHEAIGVVDDIQPWLPMLVALSANSPFDRGIDTGFASWREQVWDGWPSAGPVEPFVDSAGYADAVRALIASGAALDEAMIYFDVRLARNFPTVEIRVADVCTDLDDTILVAELARGLVETAARSRAAGETARPWRVELLRAARWRASHDGVGRLLVSPATRSLTPADEALGHLVDHLRPVLDQHGATESVEAAIKRVLTGGTGADRQRTVAAGSADLTAVVDDVVRRTKDSWMTVAQS